MDIVTIMASSPSASNWECGACASFNKGGKYCPMCATPQPKCQELLAALAADVAAHAAVVAVTMVVAKVILSVLQLRSHPATAAAAAAAAAATMLPLSCCHCRLHAAAKLPSLPPPPSFSLLLSLLSSSPFPLSLPPLHLVDY